MLRSGLLASALALVLASAATPASAVPILPGDLLAVKQATDEVVVIDTTGAVTTIPSQFDYLDSIAAGTNGEVFVSDWFGAGVYQLDPETGAQTLLAQTYPVIPTQPLVVASDGTLYAAYYGNMGDGAVYRIDSETQTASPVQPNWTIMMPGHGRFSYLSEEWDPLGLALNGTEELFVFGEFIVANDLLGSYDGYLGLMSVDPATGAGSLLALNDDGSFNFTQIRSFVMGPDGQLYLAANLGTQPGIYRIDPTTGAQSLFVGGLTGALASDGTSLLLATGSSILSLNTSTGTQTTLFSGAAFSNITALAIVPSVPEPASALLVVLGFAAVAGRRRVASRCGAAE